MVGRSVEVTEEISVNTKECAMVSVDGRSMVSVDGWSVGRSRSPNKLVQTLKNERWFRLMVGRWSVDGFGRSMVGRSIEVTEEISANTKE